MIKKWYHIFREFIRSMRKEHISAFSAASAFFIFLSFVPLMMLICAALPYTPLTGKDLLDIASAVVPGIAEGFVKGIISDVYEKAKALLPVAAVVLLWTAGKGVLSIVQGLNSINQVEEKRGFFRIRIMAMIYTVIVLSVVVACLSIMAFGNVLANFIMEQIPAIRTIVTSLLPFRFVVFWIVLTVAFSLVYTYIPNKKLKLKSQIPGACFAAVAWSLFSFGFSLYLEYSNSFDIYGSLAILIVVMMWLYFCMYIVFIGAYMNRYFGT